MVAKKKKATKKKATKKQTVKKLYPKKVKMYPSEPGMGELTKMAMQGAVLVGSVSLIPVIGGTISAAIPKSP